MKTSRQQAEKRGRTAEKIAALFLQTKGYRILERRFRSKRGEIDLIIKRGDMTAFVEVKARPTKKETALESISFKQRRRIEAAAEDWIKKTGWSKGSLRFDVIAVAGLGLPHHISDAWRMGE